MSIHRINNSALFGNNKYIFKHIFFIQGHSGSITHLDWSADSTHIQSTSGDYELLFCKYTEEHYQVL